MRITLCDVGPRDGLQNEAAPIPVAAKLDYIERLVAAAAEISLRVSPVRLPLADLLWHARQDTPVVVWSGRESRWIVVIFAGTKGYLDDIPVADVRRFEGDPESVGRAAPRPGASAPPSPASTRRAATTCSRASPAPRPRRSRSLHTREGSLPLRSLQRVAARTPQTTFSR